MYFVINGSFKVHAGEGTAFGHGDIPCRYLDSGKYFGEIALCYDCHRSASVIADNYSTLGVLTREAFDKLTVAYPELLHVFKDNVSYYDDPVTDFLKE